MVSGQAGVSLVVIASALLHAAWNAAAHRIPDRAMGFALIGAAYTGVCALVVPFAPLPTAAAWPFLGASVVTHVLYIAALLRSYQLGEFAHTYPLARGTSPLVVTLAATVVLRQSLTAAEAAGILTLCAGLALLVGAGGRLRRADRRASLAALATGLAIACYTTLDGVGVRLAQSTLGYAAWLFLLQGPAVPVALGLRRGRDVLQVPLSRCLLGLACGVASLAAYGLVLWAQAHGALARVAALRETSILFGAVIGVLLFRERFGPWRLAGAAVTVAGVLLLTVP